MTDFVQISRKKAQQVLSIGRTLSMILWVSGDAILFTLASCFRFCTGCLDVIWVCGGCRSLFCFGLWAINFGTSCTFEIYFYFVHIHCSTEERRPTSARLLSMRLALASYDGGNGGQSRLQFLILKISRNKRKSMSSRASHPLWRSLCSSDLLVFQSNSHALTRFF